MNGENDYFGYNFARLRDELASEDLHALKDAGLVGADTVRYLESFREHYEPGALPHHETGEPAQKYHNTDEYVETVRREIGETLNRAVVNGNRAIIEHAMGLAEGDDHDNPFAEALQLEELIHGDTFKILVFTGGQGGGKSYFAYTLAHYKAQLCRRDGISVQVVTNSLSAVELNNDLDLVKSPRELLDYRMEHHGEIVFVLDEASSFFDSKAGGHGAQLAKFVPVLRRMRKMRILPIIVSHRAMDIGTDIRNLESTVFVDKPDKDTAAFYNEERGDGLEDKLFELSGYTTDERYEFETDDIFISWNWDGLDEVYELMQDPHELRAEWDEYEPVKELRRVRDEIERVDDLREEREELIRSCNELGYEKSEIAELAGVSRQHVNQVLSDN